MTSLQITGPSLDMECMDDLLMATTGMEQPSRPGTAHSVGGAGGAGSGRSASSAGLIGQHHSHHRVSVGSTYYYSAYAGTGRHGSEATNTVASSSARQSTCYSTQHDSGSVRVGAGVVVTSHRQSQRRSSTSSAAAAFAVATAGSSNPRDYNVMPSSIGGILGRSGAGLGLGILGGGLIGGGGGSGRASQAFCSINLPSSGDTRSSFGGGTTGGSNSGASSQPGVNVIEGNERSFTHLHPDMPMDWIWLIGGPMFPRDRKESIMSSAATMRVLSVLRHWISKHRDDFESPTSAGDLRLKSLTVEFLEDVLSSPQLLPAEHRAASQLLQLLSRDDPSPIVKVDLNALLAPPTVSITLILVRLFDESNSKFIQTPSRESIETLSALEIAEQMTVLDHAILVSIKSE